MLFTCFMCTEAFVEQLLLICDNNDLAQSSKSAFNIPDSVVGQKCIEMALWIVQAP